MSEGKIDKKYLDQMQMQMYVSGRRWCDFFAFNPNFNPNFFCKRIYADPAIHAALTEALRDAKAKLLSQKAILDRKFVA